MTTALFKSIKKWNPKKSNIISLQKICGKKTSTFYIYIYTIHCPFPINDWSIYKGGRRDTLIFFPNFTLVFLCLKLCNNHSTHVQQIMKPQVFISIQNGFIFSPPPLKLRFNQGFNSKDKRSMLTLLCSTYKLGFFFLKAVSSSYKSDFRIYLSPPLRPLISWSKRNYSKEEPWSEDGSLLYLCKGRAALCPALHCDVLAPREVSSRRVMCQNCPAWPFFR